MRSHQQTQQSDSMYCSAERTMRCASEYHVKHCG